MYKVLIADDEMIVRMGLRAILDWEAAGFTVVAEASDGQTALALCEQHRPHVVLTDINMPHMDGLAFSAQLLERFPSTKIVILSCIDEFDKVQTALRLGVSDYFLKLSFTAQDLERILQKLRGELDEQSRSTHEPAGQESYTWKDRQFFVEYFYRIAVEKQQQSLVPQEGLLLDREPAALLLIQAESGGRTEPAAQGQPGLAETSLYILREAAGSRAGDACEIGTGRWLLLCRDREGRFESLYKIARTIQSDFLRMLNLPVSIGISGPRDMTAAFYAGYQEALDALTRRFYEDGPAILGDGALPWEPIPPDEGEQASQLPELLERLELCAARKIGEDFLRRAAEHRSWNPRLVETHITALLEQWHKAAAQSAPAPGRTDAPASLAQLAEGYLARCHQLEGQIKERAQRNSSPEIEQVYRYVAEHYMEAVSIGEMAAMLSYNPSYFSHLFKRKTGKGFSEYLTQVRLQKAAELLQTTALDIPAVAEGVGYQDVGHFRDLFRQHYGLSPLKFRKDYLDRARNGYRQ